MKFRTMLSVRRLVALFICGGLLLPANASASDFGRAAVRGAERSLARGLRRNPVRLREFDAVRDRKSSLSILKSGRSVDRYTSLKKANSELKHGIAPNRHMTSFSSRKPLTANNAAIRLGLSKKPEVVERIEIPKGTSLHFNKVVGGKPGYGEITSPARLPRTFVRRILTLHH